MNRGSKASGPLGALSVRTQLAVLVLVVALPLVGLLTWSGVREYQLLRDKANARTLSLADATATSARQFFDTAEGLMVGLARERGDRLMDPVACSTLVATVNGIVSFMVNLLVADARGEMVCSAQESGSGGPLSVAHRDWFQEVAADPVFQVGGPHFGEITRRWVIALAAPIFDADGNWIGVLAGSVELRTFQDVLAGVDIGEGDLVTIANEDDVVVARSQDPDAWIGQRLPARTNPETEISPGVSLSLGEDLLGVRRSWAQRYLPQYGWWVYAGVPEDVIWAPLRASATRNAVLTLLVVAGALLLGLYLSGSLAGTLTQLVEGVRRAARGGPVPLPAGAPREVLELGEQFNATITESRLMEERLRHAQKMEAVGQLAGGVAHDFNNLLTVIEGNADFLLESLPQGSESREEAQQIADAAARAASVTRQLLTFSRRDPSEARAVDLARLSRGLEVMLQRLIGEEIHWKARISGDPVFVQADPGHLEQVILNLALNARDAVDAGGNVSLVVRKVSDDAPASRNGSTPRPPAGWALVEVVDDGVGMDASTQARIFEPFFTTKPRGRGTGLGLATVFGIVEQLEGVVEVESAPGEGTAFRIWLPLADPPEVEAALETVPQQEANGEGTLLLVEDEPALRTLAARVLERAGYTVLTAVNGREGLERFGAHTGEIDLVVTDVVMPEMSGTELADRLEAIRPGTRVLFTTGYSEDPRIDAILARDPERILRKPFRPAELLDRVRHLLGSYRPV